MRRHFLTLTTVLLAAGLGWGQAIDLLKDFPPNQTAVEGTATIAALAKLGPAGVKELLAAVGGPNDAKAQYALSGLANWAGRPGAEADRAMVSGALIDGLKTADKPELKNLVLQLLRLLARDEAVAPAAACLADDACNDYAVRLLATIGTPAATDALLKALPAAKGRSQANLARALGEAKVKAAVPALLPLAASDDHVIKEAALYALAEIGDPAAKPALAAAAAATNKIDRGVGTALYLRLLTNGRDAAAVRELLAARAAEPATAADCLASLVAIDAAAAVPDLMAALDSPDLKTWQAAVALTAKVPEPAVVPALMAKQAAARPELKLAILEALSRRGAPEGLALAQAAVAGGDPALRQAGLEAAARYLRRGGAVVLLEAMGTDDPALVAAAGKQIAGWSGDAAVLALTQAVKWPANLAEEGRRLGRLGVAGGPAAWATLGSYLNDPGLTQDACRGLALAAAPRSAKDRPPLVPELKALVTKAAGLATDPDVKAALTNLLGGPTGPAPDVNLALNKPVVEDGEHENDQVPENAVNGHTDNRDVGWWSKWPCKLTVSLKDTYRVGRIKVWFYWDGARYYQYTVETSLDNQHWALAVDRSANTKPSVAEGEEVSFPPVDAKYVRLNVLKGSANASTHVTQFEVFAAAGSGAPAGSNLALNKPVTATGEQEGNNAPEQAVDGHTDDLNVGWYAHPTPVSLTVDLKDVTKVGGCQAWFYWADGRYYQWTVEVSKDNQTWTPVVDQSKNETPADEKGTAIGFAPVDARWVRLNVLKNSANYAAHVIQFKVFAPGVIAPAAPPKPKVVKAPPPPDAEGYVNLLYDKDLEACGWTGWQGYALGDDGVLECKRGHPGDMMTVKNYADFDLKFEFKLTPGANNGIGIRAPAGAGAPTFAGMEIQILDDRHKRYDGWLKDYQWHAGIYGCVVPKRDLCKPVGEWNAEEILCQGRHVKVIVNGQVAVDADLDKVEPLDHAQHPGLKSPTGRVGFLGHEDQCWFRNVRIKELGP
jgi:HEAT repeat protein